MPASTASPSRRPRFRQLAFWVVFAVLLVLGLVLWFRFAGRVAPMLDLLTGR